MSTETETRVRTVFQSVFDDPNLMVARETTAKDVEGWDSLSHIDLIVAVEREFKIKFTLAEVAGMKNVGELMDLIARKMR